jgi:hypothetical protein
VSVFSARVVGVLVQRDARAHRLCCVRSRAALGVMHVFVIMMIVFVFVVFMLAARGHEGHEDGDGDE